MSRRIAFGIMKGSVTQKLKSMAVPIANRRHYCSSSSPATHKSNLPPSSRMGRLLTGAVIGLVGGAYVSTLDEPTFRYLIWMCLRLRLRFGSDGFYTQIVTNGWIFLTSFE
ncbi:putative dihydroorotate dehydrogenase (quinone) [Helianthus annuus]|nr:putative dihydroorotate dehydrogenase (quinone) [Helianthus annuus]